MVGSALSSGFKTRLFKILEFLKATRGGAESIADKLGNLRT